MRLPPIPPDGQQKAGEEPTLTADYQMIPDPSVKPANKRNWPEPKFRPSLNREASRLGDVRVRRPSFRALVPETVQQQSPPKFSNTNMNELAGDYHSEFLLARLQKSQCSAVLESRIERQPHGSISSAEFPLLYAVGNRGKR